jgi:predicted RNase H-like HicB family nuclease
MPQLKLHVVVFKDAESDQWVAECLEYQVTAQGDSAAHALKMAREAVQQYLEDASEPELELLFQAIDGDPELHTLTIDAPTQRLAV